MDQGTCVCIGHAHLPASQAFFSDLAHRCSDACSWLFAWIAASLPVGERSRFILQHPFHLPGTPDAPEGLASSNLQPRTQEKTAQFVKL